MSTEHTATKKEVNFLSDPAWLWGVIAGFALLIGANAIMIYYATRADSSQVVVEKPYETGLHYDETMAEAEQTRATGWAYQLANCEGAALCVSVTNREGAAIDDANVRATLVRPASPDLDTTLDMAPLGDGRYGLAALPAKGLWELTLEVERDGQRARWSRKLYLEN